MNNKRVTHRMSGLVVLLALALSACLPTLGQPADAVNSEQLSQEVATQVAAELAKQEQIVPVGFAATPVATLSVSVPTAVVQDEAQTLEQTLTRLYREVNPSVVYIIVGSSSSGSGFVYGADGTIVTNNHVARAGNSYEVVFSSGERSSAKLIGADADSDLAVLKVENLPAGVKPLSLANGEVEVGQLAIAIGNPFGEQGSMSLGIISGLGRSLPSQRAGTTAGSTYSLPQVIQTDAPINPGNSGGPLLNLQGQVIGVNAAIASTTGTNSGVGFSIPVAAVKQVAPKLIQDGKYVYPYLGASFDESISLSEKDVYSVSQTLGAYVIGVTTGSPADKAGLVGANASTGQGGDLIIDIDGVQIKSFSDLNSYLVFHTQVGQRIVITALRNNKPVTLSLTLGARP